MKDSYYYYRYIIGYICIGKMHVNVYYVSNNVIMHVFYSSTIHIYIKS